MKILKNYVLPAGYVGLLIFIDQITKWLANYHIAPLYPNHPPRDITLIDGFLRLTHLTNDGMAFGLLSGFRWVFLALTLVILVVLGFYYRKPPKGRVGTVYRIVLLTIIGGALGNFIDRLFRGGGVVDFIIFEFFPFVFNFADVFVVAGVFAFAIMTIFVIKDEPKDGLKFRKNR